MPSLSEPLANLVFLKEFSKGNRETINKELDIFIHNTSPLIFTPEYQIRQKDFPSVEITAHSLKAQFNFIGSTEGENCARQIRKLHGIKQI